MSKARLGAEPHRHLVTQRRDHGLDLPLGEAGLGCLTLRLLPGRHERGVRQVALHEHAEAGRITIQRP